MFLFFSLGYSSIFLSFVFDLAIHDTMFYSFPPHLLFQIGDAYERIKSLGGDPNNALLGGATKADSNMSEPFQLPKATEVESHCLPPNTKFAVYPVQDELASLFYGTYMRRKMPATA